MEIFMDVDVDEVVDLVLTMIVDETVTLLVICPNFLLTVVV